MNLPSQPGLRRRLIYGNIVNRRNIINSYLSMTNMRYPNDNFIVTDFEKQKRGLSLCDLIHISEIVIKNKNTNIDYCSICLDDFDEKVILRKLICNHIFHINCIEKWLSENTNCPMCRHELKQFYN
jgi:hypothetical protein